MLTTDRRDRLYTLLFSIFAGCYVVALLISPNLGVTDDFVFLRTLEIGKPVLYYAADFPYYDSFKIGRFTPANAMEYNVSLLFTDKPTPLWYYASHAVQFVALVFFLTRILGRYVSDRRLVYLAIALLALTPGFIYSWFRLQLNERDVLVLMAAFLYCYFRFQDDRKPVWLTFAAIAATTAIYYKETGFILVGGYAAAHLLLSWRSRERDTRVLVFDAVLLAMALGYVVLYSILVLPYGGVFIYGKGDLPAAEVLAKNFLNYLFVSDPVIILLVLPLTLWRIYRVFVRGDRAEPFHDALLASASLFVAAYFVLNLFGFYYFQPLYVLVIPPLFYFLRERIASKPWKYTAIITASFVALNSIPTGLHYLTYYKYAPANFNAALDFLTRDIKTRFPGKRANVFIDGVDRGTGKFTYFIFSEYLLRKGLTANEFDLRSNIESSIVHEGYFPFLEKIPIPYTVFEKGPLPEIVRGDYLIVSAHSTDAAKMPDNAEYLKSLEKDFDLVFRTNSPLAFPLINLKSVGRYLISIGAKPGERLFRISRHKPSPELPDYYIFIRK